MNEYILKTLGKVKVKKMLIMFISEYIDEMMYLASASEHATGGDLRMCWDGLISDRILAKFGLPVDDMELTFGEALKYAGGIANTVEDLTLGIDGKTLYLGEDKLVSYKEYPATSKMKK
jgi:hypothetical protein